LARRPSSRALVFFTTLIKERFWQIVFLIALIYFALLIRSDIIRNDRLNDDKTAIMKNLGVEDARGAELKNKLKMLNRSSYIEILARKELGVVRRGEEPYKVIIK
jgi:cell division protein FtsB